MTTDDELRELIARARKLGADVQLLIHDLGGPFKAVRVKSGIPGVGRDRMTPEIAAELLREFIAEREAGL